MAHGTIRWNQQSCVIRVQTCIVIWRMTAFTSIRCVGVIALVACIAIVRNGCMCSGKRINCIVVKVGWRPGNFTVANRAIGWKLRRRMVRIAGRVVIRGMTSCTSIGRVGIIPLVAGIAIGN